MSDPVAVIKSPNSTYQTLFDAIASDSASKWIEPWFQRDQCIIVKDYRDVFEVKNNLDGLMPQTEALGMTSYNHKGEIRWIGFDLDFGHGMDSYVSFDAALRDAYRVREVLGEAEIRRSKSGTGIHIKHMLPGDADLTREDGVKIVKYIARKIGLLADRSNLGRQAFWFWVKHPTEKGFQVIEEQTKPVLDLADIIVEALACSNAEGHRGSWAGNAKEFDETQEDDSVERVALEDWKPGDFSGRSKLGERNWYDMRHFCNDWGMSIKKALSILSEKGCNPHQDVKQWKRLLSYTRYPRGWKTRQNSAADLAEAYVITRNLGTPEDPNLRYWRGSWFTYNGRHYEPTRSHWLIADISSFLQTIPHERKRVTTSFINNIITNLQGFCVIAENKDAPFWIDDRLPANYMTMSNGILNIEDALNGKTSLLAHTNKYFTLTSLPYAYDATAKSASWAKFIAEVLPDQSTRELIQEWFGYNLTYDMSQHKAMFYLGEGANGKSVTCCAMKALLGQSAFSSVGLEAFDPKRTFPLAATIGKLANIVEEIGEMDKVNEGMFKAFVGGSSVTIEEKHKPAFTMSPTARLTFATNQMPRFHDRTNGIWRRLLVVKFGETIPYNRQDKRLSTVEFWDSEAPGLLNWALEGLKRLNQRTRFEEPELCRIERERERLENNPAAVFLGECCELDRQAITCNLDLYKAYCRHVEDNGRSPTATQLFVAEVKRYYGDAVNLTPKRVRLADGRRERVWMGLRLVHNSHTQTTEEASFGTETDLPATLGQAGHPVSGCEQNQGREIEVKKAMEKRVASLPSLPANDGETTNCTQNYHSKTVLGPTRDPFSGSGKNHLGVLLMELRAKLSQEG